MKLKYTLTPLFILPLIFACSIDGVEQKSSDFPIGENDSTFQTKVDTVAPRKIMEDTLNIVERDTVSELSLANGIKITWFKKGQGEKVNLFDVLRIDYKNALEDGTVYDGNHFIKKASIAFPYGWNTQTEGWKIALQYLHVGDEVDIFLPGKLARGEKGIPGLVPPNADNYLHLKVLGKVEPQTLANGVKVYTVEESKETNEKTINANSKIQVHYFAHAESTPRFENTYAARNPINIDMANTTELPALVNALVGRKNHDKIYVHIPSALAYGEDGLNQKVKPNEDVLYDLIILDVMN